MRRSAGIRAALAACAVFVAPASAQICDAPSGTAAAAGASIPSPADVLGYSLGERFTTTEEVERYARALDDASELVELREFGRTPEGRPLTNCQPSAKPGQLHGWSRTHLLRR